MLIDISQFILFIFTVVLINLTPGCDVMFVISQSLIHKRNGVLAALGVSTGIFAYIILTVAGISIIIEQSTLVFNLLKIGGAVYLLYLAFKAFQAQPHFELKNKQKRSTEFSSYYRGTLTNLFNPKVGLFFLTFLPQFVHTDRGHVEKQLLILGMCFMVSATCVNVLYALLFSFFKEKLLKNTLFALYCNKLTGAIFLLMALGVMLEI